MADNKELIDLEFDQDDYLPNSVLVAEQISEPLEVNFEFEVETKAESEISPADEKITVQSAFNKNQEVAKEDLELQASVIFETVEIPEQIISNQQELNFEDQVQASFTEIIEEATNLQNQVADFVMEVACPIEVTTEDQINHEKVESSFKFEMNQQASEETISNEPLVTKLQTAEDVIKNAEQVLDSDNFDDDELEFQEPEVKTKKFPIELVIYGSAASLLLFLINYFLFMSHSASTVDQQPKLNSIIHEIANKHVEEEEKNNKKIKLDLVKDIKGKNYEGQLTLHLENNLVKSFDLRIIGDEPPQLTPEEIVAKNKRLPWIQRIEINNLSLVSSKSGSFAGTGKARVYLDDEEVKKRVLVELSVKGDYRLAEKSAEIEVTIQEGASHLNLNEISNQSYKDNLWIKNYNDGYDLLFNTKLILNKK